MVGAGGHGRETVCLIQEAEARSHGLWNLLGVIADGEPDVALLSSLKVDFLGPIEVLRTLETSVSVAVGDGRARAAIQHRTREMGCSPVSLVHPSAVLGGDVSLGEGSYVGAMTVLTTNVRLGEGVQVNVACSISHDVVLGDFCTLSPGVHVAGGVTAERGATFYTGAIVLPHVRVGVNAVVGAGAVVTHDVPDYTTVVGIPARRIRSR